MSEKDHGLGKVTPSVKKRAPERKLSIGKKREWDGAIREATVRIAKVAAGRSLKCEKTGGLFGRTSPNAKGGSAAPLTRVLKSLV